MTLVLLCMNGKCHKCRKINKYDIIALAVQLKVFFILVSNHSVVSLIFHHTLRDVKSSWNILNRSGQFNSFQIEHLLLRLINRNVTWIKSVSLP